MTSWKSHTSTSHWWEASRKRWWCWHRAAKLSSTLSGLKPLGLLWFYEIFQIWNRNALYAIAHARIPIPLELWTLANCCKHASNLLVHTLLVCTVSDNGEGICYSNSTGDHYSERWTVNCSVIANACKLVWRAGTGARYSEQFLISRGSKYSDTYV